jgi:hypothetical protein
MEVDGKAILLDPQLHPERPVMAAGIEAVALEQVEDGNPAFMLDIGVAAQDGALVQLDVDDPRFAHDLLVSGCSIFWPARLHGIGCLWIPVDSGIS